MKPKAPQEDPQARLARMAEQQRADAAFVTNTQDLIDQEMRTRSRRFGTRVAMSGVSPGGGSGTGGPGGGMMGGGGGGPLYR